MHRILGFYSAMHASVVRHREALHLLQALQGLQGLEVVVARAFKLLPCWKG